MRFKLTLAYVGSAYAGWQRQPAAPTVQASMEEAAAPVAGADVTVAGASRTDAGVHARGQVAHLDCQIERAPEEIHAALNARLPDDIRVLDCRTAAADFHARHSAIGKRYTYTIDNRPVASPFRAPFAWHVAAKLDLSAMQEATKHLLGPLDQRAFATQPVTGGRPDRPLEAISVDGTCVIEIRVAGRSFLRYAVRGLVGTLVEVGLGRRHPDDLAELARSGDRSAAGTTAPAHGLCLAAVRYAPRTQRDSRVKAIHSAPSTTPRAAK